jgi:NAD-dependent deacetylase
MTVFAMMVPFKNRWRTTAAVPVVRGEVVSCYFISLQCATVDRTAVMSSAGLPEQMMTLRRQCATIMVEVVVDAIVDVVAFATAAGVGVEREGSVMVTSDESGLAGDIDQVRTWLREASAVTVLTGAGISTDSGIPDFRGPNGVWTKNPGAEKRATLQNYVGDAETRKAAWRGRLDSRTWAAEPNDGHRALVRLERRGNLRALLTQNIDGLHQEAGSSPGKVVEIHGTVRDVGCLSCSYRAGMQIALDRVRAGEEDPDCPICGGLLKSATISFGQSLVDADLKRAEQAALDCDVLLAIGTTLGVYPIAAVVPLAHQHGAKIVILNAEPTEMDHLADAVLHGQIGEILPAIV